MYRWIIVVLCCIHASTASAQVDNVMLWSGVEVKKPLTKRWDVIVDAMLRTQTLHPVVNNMLTQATTKYDVASGVRLIATFRVYGRQRKEGYYLPDFRWNIDAQLKRKIGKRGWLKYRPRIQKYIDRQRLNENLKPRFPQWYFRQKLSFGYNLRKSNQSPYIAVETFHPINLPEDNGINQFRVYLGSKLKTTKESEIDFFLMDKYKFNVVKSGHTIVLGIVYSYDWKKKKKSP